MKYQYFFFILPYTLQKHFHCVLLYKNIYIVFCYTETLQISSYFNIQASKKGIQQISRNKSCIADLIQEWQISCYALYKSKGLIKNFAYLEQIQYVSRLDVVIFASLKLFDFQSQNARWHGFWSFDVNDLS